MAGQCGPRTTTTLLLITIIVKLIALVNGDSRLNYDLDENLTDEEMAEVSQHPNWALVDRERCGNAAEDRIIGGKQASLGQYPWIARLGYSSLNRYHRIQFSCGGSLITSCWVLSAAHCVVGLPDKMYLSGIRLGEYDTKTAVDCDSDECADPTQNFHPRRILVHRNYDLPLFKNDITLVQLDRPAIITRWVRPICLPYGPLLQKNLVGSVAEVAGWGITEVKSGTASNVLMTVKLPIVQVKQCKRAFKGKAHINELQMCVGGVVGADSCGGDSGGPLMKVDAVTSPRYYVFGIVSFGSKYCGAKPTPAVYTRLARYMHWILDNITECY